MQVQDTENVLAFSFMEVSGPDGGLVAGYGNGLFKPHQWKPLGGWTGYFDLSTTQDCNRANAGNDFSGVHCAVVTEHL